MIPKIIHYCWLSGEDFPPSVQKCIQSWKSILHDYEFILWDTKRFDINSVKYVKEAFEAKKYAFASDYIRLYALYNYGGIYLDSDIEVYKSFNELLNNKAFTGFEDEANIGAWMFGSEKGNPLFRELLDYYNGKSFIFPDGSYNMTANVVPVTNTLLKYGLKPNGRFQDLGNIVIYPREFFCPYNPFVDDGMDLYMSDKTYCKHLFDGAWYDPKQKELLKKKHVIEKKYGKIIGKIYYACAVVKKDGWFSMYTQLTNMIKRQNVKK